MYIYTRKKDRVRNPHKQEVGGGKLEENGSKVEEMKEKSLHSFEIMTSMALNVFDYLLSYHDFPMHMPTSEFCLLLLSITKSFFPLIIHPHKLPPRFWNLKNDEP